jgi:hypothetical protein
MCKCPTASYSFNQQCINCPYNSISSTDGSSCVCNSQTAYFLPSGNSCVDCLIQNYEVLNSDKSSCVCTVGYIRNSSNNKCVQNIQQCKDN